MSIESYELIFEYLNKTFPKDRELWLDYIKFMSKDNDKILLSVPNNLYKERVEEKYIPALKDFIKKRFNSKLTILVYVSDSDDEDLQQKSLSEQSKIPSSDKNKVIQKQKNSKSKISSKQHTLEQRYTFEQFVVGINSQLAYAAAKRIAEYPGTDYNPLFIYGGVGLGKTHLMQAIGHDISKNDPLMQVIYITSEQFTNEYINSLQKGTVHAFRLKFRYSDILLVDDIQFLEQKEGIQEELFHTFNILNQSAKQMVFTSDRSPQELKKVTDRLISRFASGLVADIKPPNFETRKAIIQKKLAKYNILIKDEIIDFLAKNITNNVRDLEAAVIKTKAIKNLLKEDLTLKVVGENLKDILQKEIISKKVSVEDIQKQVSRYYNVSFIDLKSKKRNNLIVKPRHISIYLAKELTSLSTTDLGHEFGGRTHSTIISAYSKIEKELKKSESIRNDIENIKMKLSQTT